MHLTTKTSLGPIAGLAVGLALASLVGCGSDPATNPGGTGGTAAGTGGRPGTGGGGGSPAGSGGSPAGTGGVASGGTTGSGGSPAGSGGSATDGGGDTSAPDAETGGTPETGGGDTPAGSNASFFITSRTGDGNLGGLDGADKICQDLAAAVGLGGKTWKAYLSNDTPKVDAKSRIGNGPWYNIKGVKIADDIAGLHTADGSAINGANGLTEKGAVVSFSAPMNEHDIITGSNADGTLAAAKTCTNWTGAGVTRVGHHNRAGGGGAAGMSWNSAHDSSGCSAAQFRSTGGAGRFYCFATTP